MFGTITTPVHSASHTRLNRPSLTAKPALEPPPGVTPNFDHPENHDVELLVIVGICATVSTCMVLLRTYVKWFIVKKREWEDYLFLLGWMGLIAFMGTAADEIVGFLGMHQWDFNMKDRPLFLQYTNTGNISYLILVLIIKSAITLQLLHIFAPSRMYTLFWLLWVLFSLNAALYIICICFSVWECVPRARIWDNKVKGKCYDLTNLFTVTAAFNAISDLVMLALPIWRTWRLKMDRVKRLKVSAVFAMGIFGTIASTMRLVVGLRMIRTRDGTLYIVYIAYWAFAELTTGIFIGSLPTLPAFYRAHLASPVTSASNSLSRLSSKLTTSLSSSKRLSASSVKLSSPWAGNSSRSTLIPLSKRVSTPELPETPHLESPPRPFLPLKLDHVPLTPVRAKGDGTEQRRQAYHELGDAEERVGVSLQAERAEGDDIHITRIVDPAYVRHQNLMTDWGEMREDGQ